MRVSSGALQAHREVRHPGDDRLPLRGRQERADPAHAVGGRFEEHRPVGHAPLVPDGDRLRVELLAHLAGLLCELRHRQPARVGQHRRFERGDVLRGEPAGLVDEGGRVPVADLAGLQHRQGRRQGVHERAADRDQGFHGAFGHPKRAGQFRHEHPLVRPGLVEAGGRDYRCG